MMHYSQLLITHEPFNALFLFSLYLRVSSFLSNKGSCLLIPISTHWPLTSVFSMSSQLLLYNSQDFLLIFSFYVFGSFCFKSVSFKMSLIVSFLGVNKQLQSLVLSMSWREKIGLYWGYSEPGKLDSSSGQMSLLAKAVGRAGGDSWWTATQGPQQEKDC